LRSIITARQTFGGRAIGPHIRRDGWPDPSAEPRGYQWDPHTPDEPKIDPGSLLPRIGRQDADQLRTQHPFQG